MLEKSTATPWSRSSFCSRTPTSRCSEQRAQPWATWPSTVCVSLLEHASSLLTARSGKQSRHSRTRWPCASNQADELPQRRSTVQRCRLHHQPCDARGQQGKDSTIRSSTASDTTGKVQGHARTKERNRSAAQHDTLWYDSSQRYPTSSS